MRRLLYFVSLQWLFRDHGLLADRPERPWWTWWVVVVVCLFAPTLPLQLWTMGTGGLLVVLLLAFSAVAGLWSVMGYAAAWLVFMVGGVLRPRWRTWVGPPLILASLLCLAVPLQGFSRWVETAERQTDTRTLLASYTLGMPMVHGGAALGYPEVALEVLGMYVPFGGTLPVISAFPMRSQLVREKVIRGGGRVTWPGDKPFVFMLTRWSTRAGLALNPVKTNVTPMGSGFDHVRADSKPRFRGGGNDLVPARYMAWLPLADPSVALRMSETPFVNLQTAGWWTPYEVHWHWVQRRTADWSVIRTSTSWPFAALGLVVPLCGLVALWCSLFVLLATARRAPKRAARFVIDPFAAWRCAREEHGWIARCWLGAMAIVVVWELLARVLLYVGCLLG